MNTSWRKIRGDVRANPVQLGLVVLAILIGAVALSTAFTSRTVMTRTMNQNYWGTSPADVTFWLDASPLATDSIARRVAALPLVADAELRRTIRARAKINATDWRPLRTYVIAEFANLRVSTFRPVSGKTRPGLGEVLIERSALPVLNVKQGDSLTIRVPGGRLRNVLVAGIVHDAGLAPGWQDNAGYAYLTPETAAWLGSDRPFDELRVKLTNGAATLDKVTISQQANQLSQWLTEHGQLVGRVEVSEGKHPHADQMQAMVTLLTFFFVLAILLSGTLVANVLSALLAKQTRQIGIMRAVGGSARSVGLLYGRLLLGLAAPAVVLGLPLGTWVANAFCTMAADMLNLELDNWSVSPMTLIAELLIGITIPLLFAALPIRKALRQSTREALSYTGATVGTGGERGWLTRLFRTPQLQLAVANTFRRRGRLVLTVAALSVGGAVLLTALNLYRAIERAMDANLANRGDTIDLRLLRPMPADSLRRLAQSVPGVTYAEAWGSVLASVELTTGSGRGPAVGSVRYSVLAPPTNSRYWHPVVVGGTLPNPNQAGALIVSRGMQGRLPGLQLGASATLLAGGKRLPVRVVTVIEEIAEPALYATPATLSQLTIDANLAGALRIETELGRQNDVAGAIEEVLVSRGAFPLVAMTNAVLRQSMLDHIVILLICLTSAAIAVLLVGTLGMGTSLSLNVIERWREIGVIRAMGGTNQSVFRLLLTEGFVMTTLSVGLAVLLSLPLTAGAGKVVGAHGLYVTLPFVFRLDALALWLGVAVTVTLLTVWLTTRRSLQVPVREVLAYE
ncbi:FtsX-like permease family protein [Spirosoma montaniterrae]|uniref:ABC3 transporter permease C-terminal domain-containing protein n=1 Tax=Spirosoma montaniterrae TaxID=1178516 RepID=A0A1P9WW38_9BACT|nr:ABC transporter permease [Spirosoma montaniterrae]AQG79602.1 hypothetical protein AWR27_09860 [Spirosoma montaniterrae]